MVGLIAGHTLGYLLADRPARAISSPATILISELQTNGGSGHSAYEFIELYNPTGSAVALAGWSVLYHSASNNDCVNGWSKSPKINLGAGATISSHSYYLMAATGYLEHADARFSAGLADTSGAIRLLRTDASVSDSLAWGTGSCGNGAAATSPANGQSLERRPGIDNPTGGNAIDTMDNASDFVLKTVPEPQSTLSNPEDPDTPRESSIAATYLPLEVTELLIDPVSPDTDSKNEYVELYNPNDEAINIGGYIIKAPSSQYHLLPQILAAHSYTTIFSATSTLSLSNEGGNLQVIDPAGTPVSQSAPWPKAIPGATWAYFNDGWSWTATPTPQFENIYKEILPTSNPISDTNPTSPVQQLTYLPLDITELYIDPISPQTDANDEFVELYNPADEPIDVAGYVLKSGANLGNISVLGHHIIQPKSYLAVFSSETGLALSNSGGAVQLFDPAGESIGEEIKYGQTKPGYAWAKDTEGHWQWTTAATPSLSNSIIAPILPAKAQNVKSEKTPKANAVPKVKAAKPKKEAAPKKSKALKPSKIPSAVPAVLHKPTGHTLILFLFGLTICYVIYEFRYDIRHYYHQLRGHTKPRT